MHGIVKAMLIKELLDHEFVVGYQFKKMMASINVEVSNGSIFYNLKKFEEASYVSTNIIGKKKQYILTELGRKAFLKNLATVPKEIELSFQELGSQIPFINWTCQKDVKKFNNSVKKLNLLIEHLLEELK